MNNIIKNIDLFLTVLCSLSVLLIGVIIGFNPESSLKIINTILWGILNTLASEYLLLILICLLTVIWFAFSKYGKIRLGNEAPIFSKRSVFFMFFCASYGSAQFYWGFLETSFYLSTPPFGIEAGSNLAYEYAMAYNQFHWGPSAWSTAALCAIAVCYNLYIKKNQSLQLSSVLATCVDKKLPLAFSKLIDIIYIFATLGAVTMSVALSLPLISKALVSLFDIEFSIQVSMMILAVISIVFFISSYLGLEKGMAKISDMNVYIFLIFLVGVFLAGEKLYSVDMIVNGLSIMSSEYFRMSLWTDPVDKSGFPAGWTAFYWAYWGIFAPFTAVFIAKLAKGHTIKDVILIVLGGGSLGSWVCHGFMQAYSLSINQAGIIDILSAISGDTDQLVISIVNSLPMPTVFVIIMVVSGILFTATTVDGCSFSVAAATSRNLGKDVMPSPIFKLFWCAVISVTPLVLILVDAPLNTIKAIPTILSLPLLIIIAVIGFASIRGFIKIFGKMDIKEIENYHNTQK